MNAVPGAEAHQEEGHERPSGSSRSPAPAVESTSSRDGHDDRGRRAAAVRRRSAARACAVGPSDSAATISVIGRNASAGVERAVAAARARGRARRGRSAEYMPVTSRPRTTLEPISVRSAQDAQRQDRVLQRAPRARGTRRAATAATAAEAERVRRGPAVLGRRDDRVDAEHHRGGDERPRRARRRPGRRPMPGRSSTSERAGQRERDDADRDVDEEDPVPVDRLGQRAAGQQAERAAADATRTCRGSSPARARRRRGNSVTMIARMTAEATAPPRPCTKRAAISMRLALGEAAQRRGGGEDGEAGEEHALAADEVAEAAGERAGSCRR